MEKYLNEKFNDDEGAKRLQRDEIVLKKFGLLDRDFELKPFLVALLKEQIEAYYDSKTKTVNLLDWVDADEQKPVLAHELTHALQDQHSDLDKWDDQTPDDVSTTAAGDTDHLQKDEMDTARDAVAEGQATAVMMDYVLKPMGKSLVKDPEVLDIVKDQMTGSDSPVMARAPLLLSESMLFPYREGLSFEQDVWMDEGQHAAFAGALDRPPTSTWEIINPRAYEKKEIPSVPLLPDIHPLVDAALPALRYRPGRPARSAYSDRALRRRRGGARSDAGVERRHLLGRPVAQRQNSRRAGHHQVAGAFLSVGMAQSGVGRGVCQALRGQSVAEVCDGQGGGHGCRLRSRWIPAPSSRFFPPMKVRW